VSVYSDPHGDLVGTLTEFSNPDGACVDNVGNIYITDEIAHEITEYTHGGSQSRTATKVITQGVSSPAAAAISLE
jgi:secreted PhoX family phosphatase